jgi:hypothetical protein
VADERTLVLCKPDAVARGLVGEVIGRLERKGFRLVAIELRTLDEATAKRHYGEHEGKPFFGDLVDFITGGPLVAPSGGDGRLRMLSAGPILTAPGGYPIPVFGPGAGLEVPDVQTARTAVGQLVAGGAALIKVALEPGGSPGAAGIVLARRSLGHPPAATNGRWVTPIVGMSSSAPR